ncbi:glycosyltransferase family 4 protein [Hydrogenophaga sp. 5NK40-0174]|uniref:glycosyltransferase family 4 protein n=1 Tax=Hydrogenophaga sp. 5NK40-0174 TaxID=3127649 RepID=UPI00310B0A4D
MLPRVFVAHPMLQHAHQMAMGLYEHGMLQAFWSGTPLLGPGERPPAWMPAAFARRLRSVTIPAALRRHAIWTHPAARTATLLAGRRHGNEDVHRIFHAFDYWVARQISRLKPDIVVGFENSAFHTFRAARELGIRCVLDAPSLHHGAADAMLGTPQTPLRKEINRRKNAEVDLADTVITCSSLAARSYLDHGTPEQKLQPMLLGAELSTHTATARQGEACVPRFIYAGGLIPRKSIDLILQAFENLHAQGHAFELQFVGGCQNADWLDRIDRLPGASHLPQLAQSELFAEFAKADCLLLPSRFDSFGMVVAEAMAHGVPALVSTMTGAREIIERHPGSGWITEPTAVAIESSVRQLLLNPAMLAGARQQALAASREFTWAAYRGRIAQLFMNLGATQ